MTFCAIFVLYLALWITSSHAEITCSFQDNFCGWSPFVLGGTWAVGSNWTNHAGHHTILPPNGDASMAYAVSYSTTWAELLSEKVTTWTPSQLLVHILQSPSPVNTDEPQSQLFVIQTNGSTSADLIWSGNATTANWTTIRVTLPPLTNQRLLFRLKVGRNRAIFALADIILKRDYVVSIDSNSSLNDSTNGDYIAANVENRTTTMNDVPQVVDRDISCSFSSDTCGWRFYSPSQLAGPGVKLYNNATDRINGTAETANNSVQFRGDQPDTVTEFRLRSIPFCNSAPRKLTFWYTTRGFSENINNSLVLYAASTALLTADTHNHTMYVAGEDMAMTELWRDLDKDAQNAWTKNSVIVAETGNITLLFICKVTFNSLCAIDSISLENEEPCSNEDKQVVAASGSRPRICAVLMIVFIFLPIYWNLS